MKLLNFSPYRRFYVMKIVSFMVIYIIAIVADLHTIFTFRFARVRSTERVCAGFSLSVRCAYRMHSQTFISIIRCVPIHKIAIFSYPMEIRPYSERGSLLLSMLLSFL